VVVKYCNFSSLANVKVKQFSLAYVFLFMLCNIMDNEMRSL
jgi:hypothetical protein